jgi:membrane protein implicated in regulation of membrane protease activity
MVRQALLALWWQSRWARYAFGIGLIIGILLGWVFQAVITFLFRFGLAMLLLIPLLIVAYLLWRRATARTRPFRSQRRPVQVVYWDPEGRREHVYRDMEDSPRRHDE